MTANEARDSHIVSIYSFKPNPGKQQAYYDQMMSLDTKIVFGHGASGTGKSIISLKAAIDLLTTNQVKKILIMTEACEVGEKIGHLPGSEKEKLHPYFESVKDNLMEVTGNPEQVRKWIDEEKIEMRAINFIRGATFRNAAVILDEAQNTTKEGMKAFLTRIGKGSRLFINGDETQVDIPRLRNGNNGLADGIKRLSGRSEAISFTEFEKKDVVRDDIVITILEAYED